MEKQNLFKTDLLIATITKISSKSARSTPVNLLSEDRMSVLVNVIESKYVIQPENLILILLDQRYPSVTISNTFIALVSFYLQSKMVLHLLSNFPVASQEYHIHTTNNTLPYSFYNILEKVVGSGGQIVW